HSFLTSTVGLGQRWVLKRCCPAQLATRKLQSAPRRCSLTPPAVETPRWEPVRGRILPQAITISILAPKPKAPQGKAAPPESAQPVPHKSLHRRHSWGYDWKQQRRAGGDRF